METKTFIDELTGENYISIFNEDGSIVTMTKAHYEAQQVEHLTEIPTV